MKGLLAFLIGVTAGVGVMRMTAAFTASQARLMCFFILGIMIGMIAAGICFWGWRGE